MTATLVQGARLSAPPVTPLAGTLLDIATVTEGVSFLEPTGLFDSYACLITDSKAAFPCPANVLSASVAASAVASVGGTLTASTTYRYKIVAKNGRGSTIASNEVTGTTTAPNKILTVTWSAVTGATGYDVYRTAAGGAANSETFLTSVGAVTSYVDNGSVALGTASPPSANTATVYTDKVFEGPLWQDGIRFAVYGGLLCKSPGWDPAEGEKQLLSNFLVAESVGVERALMQTRFTGLAGGSIATDLTPAGGAVDPTVGMAILEGHASCNYGGVPTIHAPRSIGLLLFRNGGAVRVGNRFYSAQGANLASGAGYECPNNSPANTAPPADERWMYASGGVVLARSKVTVVSQIDRVTNDAMVLVERLYVAAVDCYVSAVRVKVA